MGSACSTREEDSPRETLKRYEAYSSLWHEIVAKLGDEAAFNAECAKVYQEECARRSRRQLTKTLWQETTTSFVNRIACDDPRTKQRIYRAVDGLYLGPGERAITEATFAEFTRLALELAERDLRDRIAKIQDKYGGSPPGVGAGAGVPAEWPPQKPYMQSASTNSGGGSADYQYSSANQLSGSGGNFYPDPAGALPQPTYTEQQQPRPPPQQQQQPWWVTEPVHRGSSNMGPLPPEQPQQPPPQHMRAASPHAMSLPPGQVSPQVTLPPGQFTAFGRSEGALPMGGAGSPMSGAGLGMGGSSSPPRSASPSRLNLPLSAQRLQELQRMQAEQEQRMHAVLEQQQQQQPPPAAPQPEYQAPVKPPQPQPTSMAPAEGLGSLRSFDSAAFLAATLPGACGGGGASPSRAAAPPQPAAPPAAGAAADVPPRQPPEKVYDMQRRILCGNLRVYVFNKDLELQAKRLALNPSNRRISILRDDGLCEDSWETETLSSICLTIDPSILAEPPPPGAAAFRFKFGEGEDRFLCVVFESEEHCHLATEAFGLLCEVPVIN